MSTVEKVFHCLRDGLGRITRYAALTGVLVSGVACNVVEEAYTQVVGGYTSAELETCVSGPGADVAEVLRGVDAREKYCRCVLGRLSEEFSLEERKELAAENVFERRGLFGLVDSAYARWAGTNLSIRAECAAPAPGDRMDLK